MKNDTDRFSAFVGIDWADLKHDISIAAAGDSCSEFQVIDHTPEALKLWVSQIRRRHSDGPVAICLEQSRGPLISHLTEYDFLTLFPVNPKALARYREAFCVSGSKDDPSDADLLREMVSMHRDRLRPWKPEDEITRTVAVLTEARRKAVDERTRLTNRLRSELKTFFPQALELTGKPLYQKMALCFLRRWEKPMDILRARDKTIRKFYTEHGCRSQKLIERRLKLIRCTVPLTSDKAVITGSVITVRMIVRTLITLNNSIQEYETTLQKQFDKHPDKNIFASFPGAGDALAPRLLAAWGSDRQRFKSAENMQNHAGIAPVTRRSGKSSVVSARFACPLFVRQTFLEFARCSLKKSIWAKAYYDMQRERGKGHHTVLRSLAFKWIRIMSHCWRERIEYDEDKYQKALRRTNSPLLKYISS